VKHVILYGPPAAGKSAWGPSWPRPRAFPSCTTTSPSNLVREIFPFGHPEFAHLVVKFRGAFFFESAARAKMEGLISTLVYGPGEDDRILKDWIRRVKRYKRRDALCAPALR